MLLVPIPNLMFFDIKKHELYPFEDLDLSDLSILMSWYLSSQCFVSSVRSLFYWYSEGV